MNNFQIVKVGTQKKEIAVNEDDSGRYWINEPIVFRHKTGQKTYTGIRNQVVKGRDGVFRPTESWIIGRTAYPVAWGEGIAVRNC